jgi:hypothetical protein
MNTKRRFTIFAALLGLALLLALAGSPAQAGQKQASPAAPEDLNWTIETVDQFSLGDFLRGSNSIAFDEQGYPHVNYVIHFSTNPGEGLSNFYAYQDSTGWHAEHVSGKGCLDSISNSITVDNQGYPHISSSDSPEYIYKDAWGWHFILLDFYFCANDTSIAIDQNGFPHIVYSSDFYDLKEVGYFYQDALGWHKELVQLEPAALSLVLDQNDFPHLLISNSAGAMIHKYKDNSGWHSETVDVPSGSPVIVLDSNGNPHISYYRPADGTLRYAYRDALGWHSETVTQLGDGAWVDDSYFALDQGDRPHMVYYDQGNLIYIYKSLTGWQTQIVDSEGIVGNYSAGINNQGVMWIGYFTHPNGTLKVAYAPLKGIHITPPAQSKYVAPGSQVNYTLSLLNVSGATDTFTLSASGNLWNTTIPAMVGPIASGEEVSFTVTVDAPPGAQEGETDEVEIVAISTSDPTNSTDPASLTTQVEIAVSGLTASNDSPTPLASPTTFNASVTAGSNVSYAWDFGDGTTGSGATVIHTYAEPGIFNATVTAANAVSQATASTSVRVGQHAAIQRNNNGSAYYIYTHEPGAPGNTYLRWTLTNFSRSGMTYDLRGIEEVSVRAFTPLDQTGGTFNGVWGTATSPSYFGGSLRHNATANAYAEFAINVAANQRISLVAARTRDAGIAYVSIDGQAALANLLPADAQGRRLMDLYAAATTLYSTHRQELPIAEGLPAGTHTVRVTVSGTKNAAATGTRIYLDGFGVSAMDPSASNVEGEFFVSNPVMLGSASSAYEYLYRANNLYYGTQTRPGSESLLSMSMSLDGAALSLANYQTAHGYNLLITENTRMGDATIPNLADVTRAYRFFELGLDLDLTTTWTNPRALSYSFQGLFPIVEGASVSSMGFVDGYSAPFSLTSNNNSIKGNIYSLKAWAWNLLNNRVLTLQITPIDSLLTSAARLLFQDGSAENKVHFWRQAANYTPAVGETWHVLNQYRVNRGAHP